MILGSFATLPHPFKGNGKKAQTGNGEGPTLLGVGWAFPHCRRVGRDREIRLRLSRRNLGELKG
jgi:hypothetical protein